MGKSKTQPWTLGEQISAFNFITGGLCMLITIIPVVPWRYAMASSALGSRFSMDRRYSLLHIGNQFGSGMSWFTLRRDVCRKQQEFTQADPLSAIMGAAGGLTGAGGALVGCKGWVSCKEHVSQRCMAYSVMAIVGAMCTLFQLVSCVCCFIAPFMINQEKEIKPGKEKKLAEAQFRTMLLGIVAFVPGALSVMIWVVLSDSTFKDLAARSAYPYPSAFVGCYVAGLGVFLLLFPFIHVVDRYAQCFGAGEDEEEEGEEEYQVDQGTNLGAEALLVHDPAPPGYGQPPAYGHGG